MTVTKQECANILGVYREDNDKGTCKHVIYIELDKLYATVVYNLPGFSSHASCSTSFSNVPPTTIQPLLLNLTTSTSRPSVNVQPQVDMSI